MTRPALPRLLVTLILLSALTGCGGGIATLERTLSLWRSGQTDAALARATVEYQRFQAANDLNEATTRDRAQALATQVDEVPIVARGEGLGLSPLERVSEGTNTLNTELRADLLSHEASRVARGLGVVGGLSLHQHATIVIALIYSQRVVVDDGGVLKGLDDAQRSVTIKRMALDTLERLK